MNFHPVLSYEFSAEFKSVTASLSEIDLSILAIQLCSINYIDIMGPGVTTFVIRCDSDNLVFKALNAIIDTKAVHGIEDGVAINVIFAKHGAPPFARIKLIGPEIVGLRLTNMDYSKQNESVCFEVDIKYNGTQYVSTK